MSLTSSTQAAIALKNILGKSMTDTIKGVDNEAEGIFFNLDSSNIWVNDIPGTASIAVSQGVSIGVTASLTLDGTSNGRGYFASWPVAAPSGTDPITSLPYAYGSGVLSGITTGSRVRNGIPPSYGLTFEAKPYTGASLISPGDARNWIYQYNSGVFFQQDVTGGAPSSIALYVYVGDTLSDFTSTGLGSITGVTAGVGLSGGGTAGSISLDVNLGLNSGLTFSFSGDDVILDTNIAGNGLDFTTGVLSVNTSEITSGLAGNGLTANGSALDVNVNSDSLEIISDVLRLKDTITGDRIFQDSVSISGNLTVSGTTSYVNTENLFVEDNVITLNATWSGSPVLNAGIEVNRGTDPYASLIWNESTDLWSAGVSGSEVSILLNAGTGLAKDGATVSLDFNSITGTGLTQNGSVISIDTTGFATDLAGDGLSSNGGTLSVSVGNGLSIVSDTVYLGGTLSQNTIIDNNGSDISIIGTGSVFIQASYSTIQSYNNDGYTEIQSAGDYVNMYYQSATNGNTFNIQANSAGISFALDNGFTQSNYFNIYSYNQLSGDGSDNNRMVVMDDENQKGLIYYGDYTGNFTTHSLVTKGYVDSVASSIGATSGLTEYSPGFIGLGGTLSQNTTISGDTFDLTIQDFDVLTLTGSVVDIQLDNGLFLVDTGLAGSIDLYGGDVTIFATGSVDITTTNEFTLSTGTGSIATSNLEGLVYTSDYSSTFVNNSLVSKQYVDDTLSNNLILGVTAGQGLSGGGTFGDISLAVELSPVSGLTFSGSGETDTLEVSVDGSTIQINGSGQLTVVAGASQPVYDTTVAVVTSGTGSVVTGTLLSQTPNNYSRIEVFVNGQRQRLDGTTLKDCYFSNDGGLSAISLNSLVSGDQLYWNGGFAGFELSFNDIIEIVYEF
jgi:hypothetical protein